MELVGETNSLCMHPRWSNAPQSINTLYKNKCDLIRNFCKFRCYLIKQIKTMQLKENIPENIGPPSSELQQFETRYLDLSYGKWEQKRLSCLLGKVKSWSCECLLISNNNHPKIIKEISGIQFDSLLHLNLSYNNIQSVQMLCNIRSPSLQVLDLSNNKIQSFQQLKKLSFGELKSLHLQQNTSPQIQTALGLPEGSFEKLEDITLDYYFYQKVQFENINWFMKLGLKYLKSIYIDSSERIIQQPLIHTFYRKFPLAEVHMEKYQTQNSEQSQYSGPESAIYYEISENTNPSQISLQDESSDSQ